MFAKVDYNANTHSTRQARADSDRRCFFSLVNTLAVPPAIPTNNLWMIHGTETTTGLIDGFIEPWASTEAAERDLPAGEGRPLVCATRSKGTAISPKKHSTNVAGERYKNEHAFN
ncbi:MAG: hypothetical protein ACLFS4_07935 [Opitutales bacterium]